LGPESFVDDRLNGAVHVARQIVDQRHVVFERRVSSLELEVIVDRRGERGFRIRCIDSYFSREKEAVAS
jgi:hypothetical protein